MIRFDSPTTESTQGYLGSKTVARTWEAKAEPGKANHHEFQSRYERSPGYSETVTTSLSVRRVTRSSIEDGEGHGQLVDELQISVKIDTLHASGRMAEKHGSINLRADQLAHFLRACTEHQG